MSLISVCVCVISNFDTDATERPGSGHRTDPPAVEPEPLRRRRPALLVSVETLLVDADGHRAGLGALSSPLEALRHLGLPRPEGLCLAVSFPLCTLTELNSFCLGDLKFTYPPRKCLERGKVIGQTVDQLDFPTASRAG